MSKKRKTKEDIPSEHEDDEESTTPRKKAATSSSSPPSADWVELGGRKRVTVSRYKQQTLVGIREFYEKQGEMLPGKKGVSLTIAQFRALQQSMDKIDAMINKSEEES